MKFTLVALAIFGITSVHAQEVRIVKVDSVTPIQTNVAVQEPRQICTKVMTPIYREVPQYTEAVVYQSQQVPSGAPLLGMLIGAAIGNRAFNGHGSGSGRAAGTVMGGAIGYGLGVTAATQVTGVRTLVPTGYHHEISRYQEIDSCQMTVETVYRTQVTGYQVGYYNNGLLNYVTMMNRPGEYIRLTTTVQ
jgi:uncharacterized protein YcfJ